MDKEIAQIIEKFSEHLNITNPIIFIVRELGWIFIKGLGWLVDSLENIDRKSVV